MIISEMERQLYTGSVDTTAEERQRAAENARRLWPAGTELDEVLQMLGLDDVAEAAA